MSNSDTQDETTHGHLPRKASTPFQDPSMPCDYGDSSKEPEFDSDSDSDSDGDAENEICTQPDTVAPSVSDVQGALNDITNLLRPPRKGGKGFQHFEGDDQL